MPVGGSCWVTPCIEPAVVLLSCRCADPLCVECDAATQKKCSSCREFSPTPPYVGVYMDARGKCHECTVKGCELCGIDGRCRRCEYGYSKVKPEGKCMVV